MRDLRVKTNSGLRKLATPLPPHPQKNNGLSIITGLVRVRVSSKSLEGRGKLLVKYVITLSRSFAIILFHRELASHRSGLPREAPCYPDTKTNFCPYTNDQMIQRMRNVTLLHEPGKEPYYRLENLPSNRPFPGYLVPLFQNESSCNTFHKKMSLIFVKMNM